MSNITLYDDFTSFFRELVELLKEDWIKFKLFITKNKKYCLWILILLITMQFTDLLNLGSSWDRYCKKHEGKTTHIHIGGSISGKGDGTGLPSAAAADAMKADKEKKKADKAAKKEEKKQKGKEDKAHDAQKDEAKKNLKDQKKADKTKRSSAGPVFGSYDKIAGMVSGMFVIITFILIVIGIISLPVLVFIVITYTILKFMANKISVL